MFLDISYDQERKNKAIKNNAACVFYCILPYAAKTKEKQEAKSDSIGNNPSFI